MNKSNECIKFARGRKKKGWFEQTYSQYPNYIIFFSFKNSSFQLCLLSVQKEKGRDKGEGKTTRVLTSKNCQPILLQLALNETSCTGRYSQQSMAGGPQYSSSTPSIKNNSATRLCTFHSTRVEWGHTTTGPGTLFSEI